MENYRDIPGYEGRYIVSDLGNVKNLITNYILRGSLNTAGYLQVSLRDVNGKINCLGIHQVVAIAFLGHTPNGHVTVVDHINNNKHDNRLENLQIIDVRKNRVKDIVRDLPTGVNMRPNGKFRAKYKHNNIQYHIGTFTTIEEASEAYQEAISKL